MARQDVLAVVLGGGWGTGLYPLTKLRTKPAVPIGGKYRLIDIPISNCIHSGITRIFVLTQFLPASLHRHVSGTYRFDVFGDGFVEILTPEQTLTRTDWYRGTADAVRRQLTRIASREPNDVLVLAGDHLYRMDYGELVGMHRQKRADVTLAAIPLAAEEAPRLGILKADEEGRVLAFGEKPQDLDALEGPEGSQLASMGVYLFRLEVLAPLLEGGSGDDFGRDILPTGVEAWRVYTYPFEGYWEDVGTISAFYEANLALTRPDPPFDFYDALRPVYTRSRFLPASRVDDCHLERTLVADGCWLCEADVIECVVGLRSMVCPKARLRRVVMMGADYYETKAQKAENRRLGRPDVGIGQDAYIERAIIDKNARIGRGVIVRSHEGDEDRDEERYSIRDGIVVVPKDTAIPDGTTI